VQQRLEIMKLLYREASILILDEPTAVLTPQETTELFGNLRKLAAEGKTAIIITHKLKEVMALADEVTVFRAGRVVGTRKVSETSAEELASLMVGRKISLKATPPPEVVAGDPILEVKGLTVGPAGEVAVRGIGLPTPGMSGQGGEESGVAQSHQERRNRLTDVSFSVCGGEIVGIAGVEGNGQSDLLQTLLHPAELAG
jgi:general nucleoside transport system ATP-binding protein